MTTRKSTIPRADAIAHLRDILPPGSTVYTTLDHVSRSGMLRVITLRAIVPHEPHPVSLNGYAAAVLDERMDERHGGGIRVPGAGMDMGFHLVSGCSTIRRPAERSTFGRHPDRATLARHSMEVPDMAATQTKPDPVELRKRYAAACEAERARPSKDAARATDAAAEALYRALRAAA